MFNIRRPTIHDYRKIIRDIPSGFDVDEFIDRQERLDWQRRRGLWLPPDLVIYKKYAAIAYDNSASGNTSGGNLSFNIVIGAGTGNATVVYANEAGGALITPTTVSVGGVAAVQTGVSVAWGGGVGMSVWVAHGVAAGTKAVAINYAAAPTLLEGMAISFTGVNQTTPLANAMTSVTGTGTSNTATITPNQPTSMIVSLNATFSTGGTATPSNLTSKFTLASQFDFQIGINGPTSVGQTIGWSFATTTYGMFNLALQPPTSETLPELMMTGCGSL